MVFIGLQVMVRTRFVGVGNESTYKWETAICAGANLRLVQVDKDPGVAQRPTAAVAFDCPLVDPANWLLVDELDSCGWCRLRGISI